MACVYVMHWYKYASTSPQKLVQTSLQYGGNRPGTHPGENDRLFSHNHAARQKLARNLGHKVVHSLCTLVSLVLLLLVVTLLLLMVLLVRLLVVLLLLAMMSTVLRAGIPSIAVPSLVTRRLLRQRRRGRDPAASPGQVDVYAALVLLHGAVDAHLAAHVLDGGADLLHVARAVVALADDDV